MAGGRTREGTRAPKPLGERLPVLARTGIAAWCLAVAPPQGPAAGQIVPGQATRLVLTDARWVDVEEGRVIAGRALIIDGGRIEWIGSADDLGAADAAMAIDLDGRFVSPGLVDVHVHTDAAAEPLFLANGVTAVRVMMGTPEALAWRARTEEADGAALRVYVAGPLLAGTPVPWAHEIVEAPEAARASVARHADAGYDYIKVYDGLSPEVYRAIVEEADRRGIPIVGHVPLSVGLEGVVAAGQRSIEHTEQVMYAAYGRDGVMTLPFGRLGEAVEALAGHEIFLTPTLAGQERIHRRGTPWHEARYADPSMRWADPSLSEWWSMGRGQPPDPEALERRRRFYLFQQELTIALHRAGVTLLARTDTPHPLLVPGLSLHEELAALVDAGLTPLEALRAATVSAGRLLEPSGELGVIRRGALADLVILDRNPLDHTDALRRPWAVVSRGALLDRAVLDAMLDRAAG